MRKALALGVLSLVLASAACGGKGSTASPASPSPMVAAGVPPSPMSGAVVSGTVAALSASGAALGSSALSGMSVQVVGTSVTSPVSAAGEFSLRDVPPGDVSLKVSGAGADAVVGVAGVQAGQTIQISIVVSGSIGRLEFDSRGGASGKQELEGLIESKAPPDMLVVHGQAVKVLAGTTDIRKGDTPLTYADLTVGWRIHVRGAMSAPGVTPPVLTADLIIVQDSGGGGSTDVKGTVGAILSGSCSSFPFKFTVGTTTVSASSVTVFSPACSAIVVGAMVDAEGALQPDGSLLASRVDVESAHAEIKGSVLAITGGTCGANTLAFTVAITNPVGTKHVMTNASTFFKPSCSAVVVGATLEVEGTLQADGTIVAMKIDVEESEVEADVAGTVLAITGGTCAGNNLAFSVTVAHPAGTMQVVANAATSFEPACSWVVVGAKVDVEGMLQAGGSMLAKKVDIEVSEVHVQGTVLAVTGGTCGANNLAFSVTVTNPAGTKVVHTSASTMFKPSCGDVAVGAKVDVEGLLEPSGSVLARHVDIEHGTGGGGGTAIDLRGTISGLASTAGCPVINFNLGATPVRSQASTMFKPSCGVLKNGDSVDVTGTMVSGTLVASKIDRR
jgi:hypothetical protein